MKANHLFLIYVSAIIIVMISCSKSNPCPSPKAHIPSFSQNKFHIKVGDSVTYTYTGVDVIDKENYSVEWEFIGGIPATSRSINVIVVYPTIGVYKVTCKVIPSCYQNDIPFITKEPAIDVIP